MSGEFFWHNLEESKIGEILKTDFNKGLSEEEAKLREKQFGKNSLPEEKPLPGFKIFFEQFRSPLIYILIIAFFVTLALRHYTDSIIIFAAVFLNITIGFVQERKTSRTLQELKKIISHQVQVQRGGEFNIIDSTGLVPGDVIILNPGSKVPADSRLIESHELRVDEMILTGEWLATKKEPGVLEEDEMLAERSNMVYMGTIVQEGKGRAVVVATGILTEIGKIAERLKEAKEEKTPYQKKIAHFSRVVGTIMLFFSLLIFVIGMASGQKFVEMFTTTVAVAVAVIPEGLPVAVTLVFTFGMREILKRKGLVRKLVAAETLGSTSIICSDKTGTLTEGKMEVAEIVAPEKDHFLALKIASFCSEAFIENLDQPMQHWIFRGRPTDKALLMAAIQAGINKKNLEEKEQKIDEIPFDPRYKYSAALHRLNQNESIIYLMGAPEVIFEKSKIDNLKELQLKDDTLTLKGYRVVALAFKIINNSKDELSDNDLQGMTFVGFIALHDPLRKAAKNAILTCYRAGIRPIIVTGDHKFTAKAIAEKIGFKLKDSNILEGRELDKLSDQEFKKIFEDIDIYARVTPDQKLRIIQAWQEKGEVVAMTGDGVNDALALKKANIGVALGSGTEVAKEASDLVLLNDDFEVIVIAVEEGRRIIDNIRKIITYLLTGGFTELVLIGLAVIFRLPLPVLAGQILWKNLIESTPPSIALTFEPKEKDIMTRMPERANLPLLSGEMKFLIFVIGMATNLLLFGIFLWFLHNPNYGMAKIDEIRTIMFAGLAIDSFFFIFSFRNLRKNIWQYNPLANPYVNLAAIAGFLLLIAAIYLPFFQQFLRTSPLGFFEWSILIIFGLINIILIEAAKWYWIKNYDKASN